MKIKNLTTKLAIFMVLAMLVLSIPLMAFAPITAHATDIPAAFRWHVQSVFLDDFAPHDGSFPASPTQFTGEFLGHHQGSLGVETGIVAGVIPLDHRYMDYFEQIGLGAHPEFNTATDIPAHPHGQDHNFPSTNANVLMINTNNQRTAYGFSTQEFDLEAHSFYRFSVWVRTGDFSDNEGAAVTLTGMPTPIGVWNINTVSHLRRATGTNLPDLNPNNRFGFENIRIYLATGATTESVALQLSVGDAGNGKYFPSNGFAFFDAVRIERLSPTNFFDSTQGIHDRFFYTAIQNTLGQTGQSHHLFHRATARVYDTNTGTYQNRLAFNRTALFDMNHTNYLMSVPNVEVRVYDENDDFIGYEYVPTNLGRFDGPTRRMADGWSVYQPRDPNVGTGGLVWGIFNAGAPFVAAGAYGLTEHPMTSTGISTANRNNSILVLSSHAGGAEFNEIEAGIISDAFTIEAGSLYSLSFWFNTQHLSGPATAVISGQSTIGNQNFELTPVPAGNLITDENYARYGWQRREFFIQGSLIADIDLNLELWLGRGGERASGIIMFDQIMMTRLNYADFIEQSAHGTQVMIDAVDHGSMITNSAFGIITRETDSQGNTLPLSFPAIPASWDFLNTNTANHTTDASLITYDYARHGIIPTQEQKFDTLRAAGYIPMINRPLASYDNQRFANNNVLMLHTPATRPHTAFGYRSPSFNVSEGEITKAIVNMNINTVGDGANLLLRSGNRTLASIQNIQNTGNAFRDFAFYVDGDAHTSNLTIEIWLGMTDGGNNLSRLAAGTIIINNITIESEPMTFDARYTEFITMGFEPTNFAVYSADAFRFNTFDRHTNTAIRHAADFNSINHTNTLRRYGIISTLPSGQTQIPATIVDALNRLENRSPTSVILQNINDGHSQLASLHTFNLNPNSFYRVEFDMLVYLHGIDNIDPSRPDYILERARIRATRGASIHLGNNVISNIRDTVSDVAHTDYVDGQFVEVRTAEFRRFSFYFATGESLENFSWQISLGAAGAGQISGIVVVNNVRLSGEGEVTAGEFAARLAEYEDYYHDSSFMLVVDNSVEPDDEVIDDGDDDNNVGGGQGFENLGFLIAGILFAVAILIVLIAVAGKKVLAIRNSKRPPSAKRVEKVASYDRRQALEAEEAANIDDSIDSFDDEANIAIEEQPVEETIIVESDEFDDDIEITEPAKKEKKEFDSEFDD